MKFDDLDAKMRVYETAHDHRVLPEVHVVARVDGRNFTRLTKDVHAFEAPFDARFRDLMLDTVEHLMDCGFRVVYGYTQSDEISLLFHRDEQAFGRKARKYNSVLAGEASARFSRLLGAHACFDCRVCELPNAGLVRDYFRWRAEDARRNALNAHCYWALRNDGRPAGEATDALRGLSVADKNDMLRRRGTDFDDLPAWQTRGVGLWWETYERDATNPTTGETVAAIRRRVRRELELPAGEAYERLVLGLVNAGAANGAV